MRPTSSLTRVMALGVAAVVASAGAAVAAIPDDAALPDDTVAADRYAGPNRQSTAGLTALGAYPDGADTALIARGDVFPDGLAASYLAGVEDAPILLGLPGELPVETQDAMQELGTRRAIIVGGPTAIGRNVENRLEQILGADNVDRISGQDRFETAAVIANQVGVLGSIGDLSGDSDRQLRTAIVASGQDFPDALAAGPLAHAAHLPVLLTARDRLPGITRIALESGVEQVIVAGGPASVSNGVMTRIRALDDVEVVHRVHGADRTATAVALADLTREQLGWPDRAAAISLGIDFPDALSLAPAASRMQAPILLARSPDEAGPATFAALQRTCDTLDEVVIAGGHAAVGPTTERQVELATSCADHAFTLDADQVVGAAGDPEATGNGWVWTDSLCYAVATQGLSHPASGAQLLADVDGGTQLVARLEVPSPTTGNGLSVGCLTDEQVQGSAADLRAALQENPQDLHVRVVTTGHPRGAIRGQLAPDPDAS